MLASHVLDEIPGTPTSKVQCREIAVALAGNA